MADKKKSRRKGAKKPRKLGGKQANAKSEKSGHGPEPPRKLLRSKTRRLAILTGGGDCPGLNAVIRAVVKTAILRYGIECHGIESGFQGLIYRKSRPLQLSHASGIIGVGGTILGSSNKDNPFRHPMTIKGKEKIVDVSEECIDYIRSMGWDCIIAIGGDGTLTMAHEFSRKGVGMIGVPKTIDNDLSATDFTFGFPTAVETGVYAIDRLHTTAMSHHRIQIIEMMGRYTGHLALRAGVAGGGDIILIPEIPYDMDIVCEVVRRRSRQGKRFSIVVVAEGAKPIGGNLTVAKMIKDSPDPIRLGGIAHVLAEQIMQRTGLEARATVLGHLQRGGPPMALDRLLATELGFHAVELAAKGKYGRMVALRGNVVDDVSIAQAIHKLKEVRADDPLIDAARAVGTCFGDRLP